MWNESIMHVLSGEITDTNMGGMSKDSKHNGKRGTILSSNKFFRVEIAVTNMYICQTYTLHAVTCCC